MIFDTKLDDFVVQEFIFQKFSKFNRERTCACGYPCGAHGKSSCPFRRGGGPKTNFKFEIFDTKMSIRMQIWRFWGLKIDFWNQILCPKFLCVKFLSNTLRGEHTLHHGEALLVVTAGDAEDVT